MKTIRHYLTSTALFALSLGFFGMAQAGIVIIDGPPTLVFTTVTPSTQERYFGAQRVVKDTLGSLIISASLASPSVGHVCLQRFEAPRLTAVEVSGSRRFSIKAETTLCAANA